MSLLLDDVRAKFFELHGASVVLQCLKLTRDPRIPYVIIDLLGGSRQKTKIYDVSHRNFVLEMCLLFIDSGNTDQTASAALTILFELISDFRKSCRLVMLVYEICLIFLLFQKMFSSGHCTKGS